MHSHSKPIFDDFQLAKSSWEVFAGAIEKPCKHAGMTSSQK